MKKTVIAFLSQWGALMLAIPFLGFWTWNAFYAPKPSIQKIACASLSTGCSTQLNQQPLFIQFLSPPSGKAPFVVRLQGSEIKTAEIELKMQGMEMPPARFPLKKDADGTFKATLMLPICSLSRSDWRLELRLNEKTRMDIAFSAP